MLLEYRLFLQRHSCMICTCKFLWLFFLLLVLNRKDICGLLFALFQLLLLLFVFSFHIVRQNALQILLSLYAPLFLDLIWELCLIYKVIEWRWIYFLSFLFVVLPMIREEEVYFSKSILLLIYSLLFSSLFLRVGLPGFEPRSQGPKPRSLTKLADKPF